jgi:hypothetical protein
MASKDSLEATMKSIRAATIVSFGIQGFLTCVPVVWPEVRSLDSL